MRFNRFTVGLIVGTAGLSIGLLPLAMAQPGTPAKAPQPSNPSPRPNEPGQQPGQQQPGQQPGQQQPGQQNPNDRRNPNSQRNGRPFAFQNPSDEARFNEGSQRLVRMEQRFNQSHQELTKRLGDIRQMSVDRQGTATMDLLQQMLKSQSEMQQYLVSSRTLWTGDVDASGMDDSQQPGRDGQPLKVDQPVRPATTPGR